MRVINIIVSDCETGIISLDSFGIVEEQLSSDVEQDAEDHFIQKCVSLKFGESLNGTRGDPNEHNFYRDEVSEEMEDGYVTIGDTTVSIVWSDIENVQL